VKYISSIWSLIPPSYVNKKQGTICIFIDFQDLKITYPIDNIHIPFINQVMNA